MNVSVEAIYQWLVDNNYETPGAQSASDAAVGLMEHLRADEAQRQNGRRDTRNIHDALKSLTTDDINENLAQTRAPLVSIMLNVVGDFNLGTAVRNACWYNVGPVWIVGRKRWDRRGAVGTQNYTDLRYSPDIFAVIADLRAEGYRVIAAEITDDAAPLSTYEWQEKTAVIYGEEGAGVSQEVLAAVDDVVFIPGRGSVRSLNVGTTTGSFMYDYSVKRGLI